MRQMRVNLCCIKSICFKVDQHSGANLPTQGEWLWERYTFRRDKLADFDWYWQAPPFLHSLWQSLKRCLCPI